MRKTLLGSVIDLSPNEVILTLSEARQEIVTVDTKVALDDDQGFLTLKLARALAPHIGDEITVTVEFGSTA